MREVEPGTRRAGKMVELVAELVGSGRVLDAAKFDHTIADGVEHVMVDHRLSWPFGAA